MMRLFLLTAFAMSTVPHAAFISASAQRESIPRRAPSREVIRDSLARDSLHMDFQDADIKSVITALATAGGLNVTYGDLPAKKVSLRLNQAVRSGDVVQILRNVALSNGLRISEEGSLITVSAATTTPQAPGRRFAGANFTGTELYTYRLRHANATRLSAVLQAIFSTSGVRINVPTSNTTGNNQTDRLSRQGGLNGTGGGGFNSGLGGAGGFNQGGGFNNQGGNVTATPFPGGFFGGPGGAAAAFQNTMASATNSDAAIVIVPDETTNSLLVRALPEDWAVIKQAIESVDLRPMQVLIEVMIAEVTRNDDLNFGVSANASNTRAATGKTTTTGSLFSTAPDTTVANFIAKLTSRGSVDVNVAVAALKTRGNVRVLSLPLIFAENNRESSLLVGSQRPFVQTFRTLATDNSARDQVVQYREVGTVLDILPTINPDGYVNLQVYQEVSAATSEVQFDAPVISTRQASASVFVKDGQTVVVGGLTDRQEQKTRSGIPVLSEIPVLGALFGTTTKTSQRTELYLFLTPHVVLTDEDAERIRREVGTHSELLHEVPVDSVRIINSTSDGLPQTNSPAPNTPTAPTNPPAPSAPPPVSMPAPRTRP